MCYSLRPYCVSLVVVLAAVGCKSTPDPVRAEVPAPHVDMAELDGSFDEVWEATRTALKDLKYRIYTRDKRGLFIAYSKQRRTLFFFPYRTQFAVTIDEADNGGVRVAVESIRQRYRVSLLTTPGWRDDVEGEVGTKGFEVLEAIRGNLGS